VPSSPGAIPLKISRPNFSFHLSTTKSPNLHMQIGLSKNDAALLIAPAKLYHLSM